MKEKIKTLDKNNEKLKLKKIVKKQKLQERGITLIALVVTIIILLILAGVTLNIALSDNGLFGKAKKAAEEYEQAQSEEEDSLLKYEYEMAKLQGEIDETETVGEYAMEKEIKEKYGQDIKIGDTVNYDPKIETKENTYDGTWKVLGIEDGKVLLISSKNVNRITLKGADDYKNAVNTLDEICEKYGKGIGAEKARSLRVEDINRITGYNPDNQIFSEGTISEYGNKITYSVKDGKVIIEGENGIKKETDLGTITDINGNKLGESGFNSLTITNGFYKYSIRITK